MQAWTSTNHFHATGETLLAVLHRLPLSPFLGAEAIPESESTIMGVSCCSGESV